MPKDRWKRLAILYDPDSSYSPSNFVAINQFLLAAEHAQLQADVVNKDFITCLSDYSAVFIRDTTHPSHYTFEFALEAERLGLTVIDSSQAILKGCNKIWQVDQFDKNFIPYPKTWIINASNKDKLIDFVSYPAVIKLPDTSFSQGVYLAKDQLQFHRIVNRLFSEGSQSKLRLVCQEFIKTDFDWRVSLFDRKILFACKYYMVDNDWKITKYNRQGDIIDGNHESILIKNIPPKVAKLALDCLPFLDDGLYGIDIKETKDDVYIIEVNDNPSIDGGVEDEKYGTKIYDTIMQYFQKKAGNR